MTKRAPAGICIAILCGCLLEAADWPQWRGPRGTGVTGETNLPVRWSATENVAWKATLAGLGVSTPIVSGNRVFVTSQVGASAHSPGRHPTLTQGADPVAEGERPLGGARPAPTGDARPAFAVEAFHRSDGRRLWAYRLEAAGPLPAVHEKHNMATPSPVTDGEMVFAWFGTGQLVALDLAGRLVWQRDLGKDNAPFEINWGHSSSPTLYGDLLILLCYHEPASYLLAVDKRTGRDRWKADGGKGRLSYSTPLVVRAAGGDELIVNSSERVDAYDPKTGAHKWHVGGSNRFPIPMPVFHDGVIYTSRGYRSGPYMAIRPGGVGDVSATHVAWEVATGAPYVSSLVFYDGLIYMANDNGIVTVADGTTGERVFQERLGGVFSASPVAADGKVYLLSEGGVTTVLRAGRRFEVLARNDIGERTLASLAISNGQIFIRSDASLFCIGRTP